MRKVLIVESEPMAGKLMEIFINSSEIYEMVSYMKSAATLDKFCSTNPVDLVLVDMVTVMDSVGLESIGRIKKQFPNLKIICITDLPVYSFIEEAKSIGADSFWYKEPLQESLIEIMDRTMEGEFVYPIKVPVVEVGAAHSDEFTKRELQLLTELVNGKTDAELAENLHVSIYTVKQNFQKLREKTKTVNRTELAVCALNSGIVRKKREGK